MSAYYNEIDPFAAQWLRNLIARDLIAPGDVDERSITDVRPDDLRGYSQCHFFAGIGGWPYALRLAGWPDDRPVWTGSCPCQPFSAAGKQRGSDDERHLWPAFFALIRELRPATVFGEQVAGAAGLAWLDHVFADLEESGYAAAAANLCAAGVGAPHIRQRLYWVADAELRPAERQRYDVAGAARGTEGEAWERQRIRDDVRTSGEPVGLADADCRGLGERSERDRHQAQLEQRAPLGDNVGRRGADGGMGDSASERWKGSADEKLCGAWRREERRAVVAPGSPHCGMADSASAGLQAEWRQEEQQRADEHHLGAWDRVDWLPCSDGKWRPVEPGTFPLAAGIPGRVGRLRAYGNAIVPQVAAAFIEAALVPDFLAVPYSIDAATARDSTAIIVGVPQND